MVKKGKGCLIWVGCFIGLFIIYLFVPKERVYKIPNRDLYIRVKVTPISDFGYIYFGKDSTSVFQSKDYLKMHKALDNIIIRMYLKTDNDTIHYISLSKPNEMEQDDFTFIRKKRLDPDILVEDKRIPSLYRCKPEFTTVIELAEFNANISISQDSSIYMKRLWPIEK